MTDEPTAPTAKPVGNGNLKPFKKGFDPRRWMSGRGKKSPEQREGEEILRAVYWKELSREFDAASGKPLEPEETLTALELAVRTQIKKDFRSIADRIAGKVTERHEFGGMDGKELTINIRKASDATGTNDK